MKNSLSSTFLLAFFQDFPGVVGQEFHGGYKTGEGHASAPLFGGNHRKYILAQIG